MARSWYNDDRTNESESKDELDRFCEAMISIRNEINDVVKENIIRIIIL